MFGNAKNSWTAIERYWNGPNFSSIGSSKC